MHMQSADSLVAATAATAPPPQEEQGRYTLAAPARGYALPAVYCAASPNAPTPAERRGRSLERRRWPRSAKGGGGQVPAPAPPQPPPAHEFHEGLLLDALLQLCPAAGGGRQPGVPSVAHRLPYLIPPTAPAPTLGGGPGAGTGTGSRLVNPYDSVPVLNHLQQQQQQLLHIAPGYAFSTFRPPASHDSSFGSDSGYSNHTSGGGGGGGGGGGRNSTRSRKDPGHRLSAHSGDLVLS